jgi:AAA15 family ATPase/GTPase
MLINFKVKNFRSIKDEQLLSMVASSQKEFIDTHTFLPTLPTISKNLSLVKTAVIYGANAAGKSNILKALDAMKKIVRDSATKYQRGDEIPVKPFLFDNEVNQPTEFEINFIYDKVRYQYGFATTKERITEEWLIAYPKGNPQNWFAREYNEEIKEYQWQFGKKLTGQKQVWKDATRSNALFLSTAVSLNSEQLKPVFDWFSNKLKFSSVDGWDPSFTMSKCLDEKYKKNILIFLKTADMDIEDIEIELGKFDYSNLPDDIPIELKEKIAQDLKGKELIKGVKFYHLDNYGKKVALDLKDESDGTQRLFSFIGPWIDSLENGNVLLIDELHDNFHPLMVKFLIEMFHNKEMNKSNAQLIFTTHETSVLNQDIFRRDQIWFCEKQNRATNLYPLTDFSPRKVVEDLEKGYLSGRYGALPFFQDISMAMENN